ncbi:hypothetical protein BGX30_013121 [Mortierella sp. GBA39]|nr:hypothetical protein BGX30_013121 [Mortierella sp. GBA39]
MDIQIREMTDRDHPEHIQIDGSFTVDSELVLSVTDQGIGYTVKPIVPSYQKSYPDEADQGDSGNLSEYIGRPDRAVYLALAGDRAVGRIMLAKNWNRYAYIEDLRVDRNARGHGIGRKLIEQAVLWAKASHTPGLMLETQSNNFVGFRTDDLTVEDEQQHQICKQHQQHQIHSAVDSRRQVFFCKPAHA